MWKASEVRSERKCRDGKKKKEERKNVREERREQIQYNFEEEKDVVSVQSLASQQRVRCSTVPPCLVPRVS